MISKKVCLETCKSKIEWLKSISRIENLSNKLQFCHNELFLCHLELFTSKRHQLIVRHIRHRLQLNAQLQLEDLFLFIVYSLIYQINSLLLNIKQINSFKLNKTKPQFQTSRSLFSFITSCSFSISSCGLKLIASVASVVRFELSICWYSLILIRSWFVLSKSCWTFLFSNVKKMYNNSFLLSVTLTCFH